MVKKYVKPVMIKMDMDMVDKIKSLAEIEDRNMSNMIRRLLSKQLKTMKEKTS